MRFRDITTGAAFDMINIKSSHQGLLFIVHRTLEDILYTIQDIEGRKATNNKETLIIVNIFLSCGMMIQTDNCLLFTT